MAADTLHEVVTGLTDPWHGQYFDAVDSTQTEARMAAQRGAPGRSIFVADYQRAGRGRQGRTWVAPRGKALLMSVLFRERAAHPKPWRWTSLASVALVEALDALVQTSPRPAIKWPNDVMLDDRKVAGVLAETTWNAQELVAIVGMGINVNLGEADLDGLPNATSVLLASRGRQDRGALLGAIIERIDVWLDGGSDELFAAWQSRLWGRGQQLQLLDLGERREVTVVGADPDGSLLVRLADGSMHRTSTGELLA